MGFQLLWRPLAALFFLRRQIRPDVGTRNDQSMHQIRMIPHQDQGKIGTVTVSHDVDALEAAAASAASAATAARTALVKLFTMLPRQSMCTLRQMRRSSPASAS